MKRTVWMLMVCLLTAVCPRALAQEPTPAEVPPRNSSSAPPELPSLDDVEVTEGMFSTWDCGCVNFTPNMLGDFVGGFYFGPAPGPNQDPRALARTLRRFKVADNNSILPRTRLEYSYNHFHDAFSTNGNVHRNFFGGELALFDRFASIALRASANIFSDFDEVGSETEMGYLVSTLKVLIYQTDGAAVSGGLAIGWPVADLPGDLNEDNYIIAPWAGLLIAPDGSNWYIQHFQQFDFPTEERDRQMMHTDFGAGWFVRRYDESRTIRTLATTAELHLYTPFGDASGIYNDFQYADVLNLTLGGTAVIGKNVTAALGWSLPLTDNKHYDWELQLHLNWFFRATNAD